MRGLLVRALRPRLEAAMDVCLVAAIGAIALVAVVAGARSTDRLSSDRPARVAGGVMNDESESERTDEPDAAMRRYLAKRSPTGKAISFYPRYEAALDHMRSMERHSTGRPAPRGTTSATSATLPGSWTELGPGNIGGRTRALVIAPGDGNTIYAAGVAGGIWKTTNGGADWNPLDDFLPNLAVNSLAMDPNNANILYAGTGEGFFNVDAVRGAGVFKTTNAGATWNPVGGTDTNSEFHYVNDVVVSKGDSQHVYAATGEGVFRSLDGGATWSEVVGIETFSTGCFDLAIRTDAASLATDTVFASCGNSAASIYRNTDAGAAGGGTWTEVYSEPAMARTSLALAPSNQNTIYALSESAEEISDFEDGFHKILRSTTGGGVGSWTTQAQVTNPATMVNALLSNPRELFRSNCTDPGSEGPSEFFNQGWYDNVIAVDPVNPDIVYAGGIDLFRSDNGGVAWGHISRWDRAPLVHADQHAIVFHPGYNGTTNKTMLVGNDGGIYKTTDARATSNTNICSPYSTTGISVPWTHLNNGYGVTQFYDGTAFPNTADYFGGTQDNGTIRGSDAGGVGGWFAELGGDGGYVAVNPDNTMVMYAEFQNFGFHRSNNGGASWASKDDLPNPNTCTGLPDECMPFITPFSMDPTNPARLFTGGWYAYRTVNSADTWVQVGPLTQGNGSVSAIGNSPADPNLLLVGMSDGVIHRLTGALTATSATPWTTVSTPVDGGWVSSVAFHPTDANIAYATYSTFGNEHVWKSENAGQTWVAIDGSGDGALPDIPVHSIVLDPNDPQTLYIGTDLGIFVSTDDGASWAVENTGFANVVTEKLEIRGTGANARLFAFTHGRGAWKTPLAPPPATPPGAPTGVAATAGNAQADVSWAAPVSDGGSAITNYVVTPFVGATPQASTEVGSVTSATVTDLTNGTAYTFRVAARNAAGTGAQSVASNVVTPRGRVAVVDFDGEGSSDQAVFREGVTYIEGQAAVPFGVASDVPVPADWDGDGDVDVAVFREGVWWIHGRPAPIFFGSAGDVPVPGDYTGDGVTDAAVFRNGVWWIDGVGAVFYGSTGDVPVPGDYDGDGDVEPAVFRDGVWWISSRAEPVFFGVGSDVPVVGDYDGDGDVEPAVFRDGVWWISSQPGPVFFGTGGDVPMPADWDGDGDEEAAIFREGVWWMSSQPGPVFFGIPGDIALALPAAIRLTYYP